MTDKKIITVIFVISVIFLATVPSNVKALSENDENNLAGTVENLENSVTSLENSMATQEDIATLSDAVDNLSSQLDSTTTTTTTTTTAGGEMNAYIRVQDNSQWQMATPSTFGGVMIEGKQGKDLIIVVVDSETGKPISNGSIEGQVSNGATDSAFGTSAEIPSWARTADTTDSGSTYSTQTMQILSNLSTGTDFVREGGVILPITEDFPKEMYMTLKGEGYKPLDFVLQVENQKQEEEESGIPQVIDISSTPSEPLPVNERVIFRATDYEKNLVGTLIINGVDYGNSASYTTKEKGQITVSCRMNGKIVKSKTFQVGETQPPEEVNGGGKIAGIVAVVLLTMAVIILYTRTEFFTKVREKLNMSSEEEKHL